MGTRRTILTQTERAFWREVYRDAIKSLVALYDGRRSRVQSLADDAGAHADAAVEQLRKRVHDWGRS